MDSIEIFKSIPLFQDLGNQELQKLGRICQKVGFHSGDRVFEFGDAGDALYIIREGEVEVRLPGDKVHGEEVIARLGRGEIFGEMALFEGEPRSASVQVVKETRMFRIKRDYLEELIEQDHEMGLKIYKKITVILCRRLRETTERLAIANSIIRDTSGSRTVNKE